jgi:GPH family glycoside/pentoside/hexuronide:cation symporter
MATELSSKGAITTPVSTKTQGQLTWLEKVGYAGGDFASCLYFGIFMNFLSYYYTDVFGITSVAVGTMIFVTRTWDWINDIIMGILADRTQTKMGKFRPWILWMMGPYAIIGVMAFTTFDLSPSGKLIYAYITYTLLTMVYTAINIPYGALMGVMTPNSEERTKLSSYRFIGAFAATFTVSGSMLYLVSFFGGGDDQLGFTLTVSLYAVIACAAFMLTFLTSKERVQVKVQRKSSIAQDFKGLFRNGPWCAMVLISVMTILWIAVRGGVTIHYFKYVCGNEHWGSAYLTVSSLVQFMGVMMTAKITMWFGSKKAAYFWLNLISAGFMLSFFWIPTDNLTLILIHQGLSSLIAAPLMPMFWSMIADTADYGAQKLNQRSTGLLFSAGTFSQKIGWSIGPAMALWILGSIGFEANVDPSEATISGLKHIMSTIPATLAMLAAGSVLFYGIGKKEERELQAFVSGEGTHQH